MIGQILLGAANVARDRTVQAASAAVAMPVTATTLHAVGVSANLDPSGLAGGLVEASLWLTLGSAALFGGLGGVVAELISLRGRVELPHRVTRAAARRRSRLSDPGTEVDLGIISRILLGATAALALLAVYSPPTAGMLIVNALVAGSAATGVFRLCQGRMLGSTHSSMAKSEPPARRSTPKSKRSARPAKLAVVAAQ